MNNDQFKDKTVLVTGGTGSIGREIVFRVLKQKPRLVKIYARDEHTHWLLEKELEEQFPKGRFQHIIGDIRDEKRLNLALYGVDIVFHTAGLKHIPYAEQNPEEALEINTEGGRTVLQYAAQNKVSKVIAISTDKAVYPASIMGITKLLMERLFIADWQKHGIETTFAIVRMGNILNTRGSIIPRWIEQAQSGHPITLTDKSMRRFLISIEQAVTFIFKACHMMEGREIFIPKMEEVNMFKLAQKIIGEHGAGKKIEVVFMGIREREKMTELLLTHEEKETTLENEDYFVVLPNKKLFEDRKNTYE